MRRVDVSPAALGSVLLHVSVAAAFMISWGARDLKVGSVVPVTIVASGPSAEPRPAEAAAVAQTAMTEDPVAEAPPEPAPAPPVPAPPTKSAAKPLEKAPTPAPTKSSTKPAEKSLDLDAMFASLTKPARNMPARPGAAPKGPSRAETATVARNTAGFSAATGTEVSSGLQAEFERNWSIDCSLAITRDVAVRVYFTIGAGGRLRDDPVAEVVGAANPSARSAAEFRATQAVTRSQPFLKEPRQNWGKRLYADFNAKEFCGKTTGDH